MKVPANQSWKPILNGQLGVACEKALQDLVAALSGPKGEAHLKGGLASGASGSAILFHYLDRQHPGQGYHVISSHLIQSAVEDLSKSIYGPSLYSGFTGIAWAVEHIQTTDAEEDPNEDIDSILTDFLKHRPWKSDYDLIIGLAGFGFYGLERLPRVSGRLILEQVVDHLDDLKVAMDGGFTWLTPPELLPPLQRAVHPQGYFNLGLAHGVPGIIALLGQAVEQGVAQEKALSLLEGAVAWLLAQKNSVDGPSCFETTIPVSQEKILAPRWSRLAWCYGDLGLSIALLWAARSVGRPDWEQEAVTIALKSARRDIQTAGDVDAGLCHGSAGIAHICNRLYQATGESAFRLAALTWFQRTLDYRVDGEGVAGFRTFRPSMDDQKTPKGVDTWGLLEGAVGIALALLGGLSTVTPDWDRMLAMALPPRPMTPNSDPLVLTAAKPE